MYILLCFIILFMSFISLYAETDSKAGWNVDGGNLINSSDCKDCDPNARCVNNLCTCAPNYVGDGRSCELVIATLKTIKLNGPPAPAAACKSNPCLNGGTCIDVFDGTFKCICREGWAGQLCGCKNKDNACIAKVVAINVKSTSIQNIVHTPHIVPVSSPVAVTKSACESSPCSNGKSCIDAVGGYKCICPKGKRCDDNNSYTVLLDGKPQNSPTPSDADIILNSFRPSTPPAAVVSSDVSPTIPVPAPATEIDKDEDNDLKAATGATHLADVQYNLDNGITLMPSDLSNEYNDKTPTTGETNNEYKGIEPTEADNGFNSPTFAQSDNNEIEPPATPTEDNLPNQAPTVKPTYKYKRPALIILMKTRRVRTTPKGKTTVGRTTQRRTTQRITRPQIVVATDSCNPNPCQNNGTCEEYENGTNYSCKCPEGYNGAHCSVVVVTRKVQTQTIPVVTVLPTPPAPEATPMPALLAPPVPVQASSSSSSSPPQQQALPCNNNPCMDGGTCIPLYDGTFKCVCREGYEGKLCGCKEAQGTPCNEGEGALQSITPNKPVYSVPPATTGSPKEVYYPTPASPDINNDATPPTTTPNECNNGSLPTDKPTNGCEPSFVYMIPKPARNSTKEDKNVSNKTKEVESFKLSNPCAPNPCQNGGTCHAFDNGDRQFYSCICPTGFEGTHCQDTTQSTAPNITIYSIQQPTEQPTEVNYPTPASAGMNKTTANPTNEDIKESNETELPETFESSNPCTPNPCQNGGTCHAFDNGDHHYYSCICLAGFEGTHCQDTSISTAPKIMIYSIRPAVTEQTKVINYPTGASRGKNNNAMWPTGAPNGCNQGPLSGNNPIMGCKPSYVVMMTPKTTPKATKQNNEYEEGANPCTPNPCQNGGTCHAFDNGDHHYYSCICPVGFEGTHCQEDICSECHIYAICPKGKCKCKFGYDGDGYDCVNATTKLGEARDFTDFTMPLTTKRPVTTSTMLPTEAPSRTTQNIRPVTTTSAPRKAKKCIFDIAFLLDSSGSIWRHYQHEKQFVKSFSQKYGISENGSHAGVITFGSKAEIRLKLSDHTDQLEFNEALTKIPHTGGSTRIDLALKEVKEQMFNLENGGRKGIKKLVVLVTDGEQTGDDGEDPVSIAKSLKEDGIIIIVIGIGELEASKLWDISGKDNWYLAHNSTVLNSKEFLDNITIEECSRKPAPKIAKKPKCNAVVDIGFVLDSSGSVWKHYDNEKKFVKSLAEAYGISKEGTHAGVVAFSSNAEYIVKLKEHNDLAEFSDAVDNIRHMGGSTRIDLALKEVKDNVFTKENGGRPGIRKLVVLLTDGHQTGRGARNPNNIASELLDDGITVVVIGIGSLDQTKLAKLAGEENFYLASNFTVLSSREFVENLTNATCEKVAYNKPSPKCNQVVDIGFILDSSGSLRANYGNEKKFLKTLAEAFGVGGENGSHAGVVTFSSRAEHSIKLNDSRDLASFYEAVDMIRHMNGYTKIDKALKLVKNKMFTKDNGGRDGVKKVVVLITDGEQTGKGDPAAAARQLRDDGITLLVIGIGDLDKKKLEKISGKNNWYLASNFSVLNSKEFVENMTHSTCGKIEAAPLCNAVVDVGFILDSSGSLRKYYQQEKQFLKKLAEAFGISEDGSHASVVTFSSRAEQSIKFSDYTDLAEFDNAVDNIRHMNGYTKIDKALRKAKDMFTKDNGSRKGVKKLVVLLTDGEQTGKGDPAEAAKELRDDGIALLVIGIGHLDSKKLTSISGEGNWYLANNFTVLNSKEFVENMTKATCEGAKAGPQYVAEVKPKCSALLDIGFILDSSGSLRKYYGKEKKFLKSLTESLGISEKGNHAGVVTFSSRAEHSIKLNKFNNIDEFSEAVDGIRHMNGYTRIDLALAEIQKNMFAKENGARAGIKKLVVLITDGEQTGKHDPYQLAKKLRESGVTLIVVGVGDLDKSKLAKLSGKNNWYIASNFSILESKEFVENMTKATCDAIETSIAIPTCKAVVDIAFILDSSGSLRKDYGKEKKFLKTLAGAFGISENGSHAGVVTFSSRAEHSIKLNDYQKLAAFNEAVDKIRHMNGYTKINKAIRLVKKKMFTKENGGRSNVKKIVVLLTDGEQTGSGDPTEEAKKLRNDGITLIVIGIGDLDTTKLEKIAGKGNWHTAANFTVLNSKKFVEDMTKATCEIVETPSALPKVDVAVDIGIIVDTSGASKWKYLNDEKQFVVALTEAFGVSKNGVHLGVVSFASHAELKIRLNQFDDFKDFSNAVINIGHEDGRPRFDLALQEVRNKMFIQEYGGRSHVKKLIVLVTWAEQLDEDGFAIAEHIAKSIRDEGIRIVVIGIGNLNDSKLMSIAGKDDWYRTNDFKSLNSKEFVDNMTQVIFDKIDALEVLEESKKIVSQDEWSGSTGDVNKTTHKSNEATNKTGQGTKNITVNTGDDANNKTGQNLTCSGAHTVANVHEGYNPCTPQTNIFNINLGTNYVFNGLELHQSPQDNGSLTGQCPQDGGRQVYEVEEITLEELIRRLKDASPEVPAVENAPAPVPTISSPCPNTEHNNSTAPCVLPLKSNDTHMTSLPIYQASGPDKEYPPTNGMPLLIRSPESLNSSSPVVSRSAPSEPHNATVNSSSGAYPGSSRVQRVKSNTPAGISSVSATSPSMPVYSSSITTFSFSLPSVTRKRRAISPSVRVRSSSVKDTITPKGKSKTIMRAGGDFDFFNFKEWEVLDRISNGAGCNRFLSDLMELGILQGMKEIEHLTIFCPVDSIYKKLKPTFQDKERKKILMNHVAVKQDKCGTLYKTLYPGGKIIVRPNANKTGKEKVTWKANGIDILLSLADRERNEIVIINNLILPITRDVLDVLEDNEEVSVFHEMWRKSHIEDIFVLNDIEKVCLTKGICVSVTKSMQNNLKDAIMFKEFTIIAPTNSMFKKMETERLAFIMKNSKTLKIFLRDFVFLGSLESPDDHRVETAYSLSPKHNMLTLSMKKNMIVLTDANNQEYKVKSTIPVSEGMLHIVEKIR